MNITMNKISATEYSVTLPTLFYPHILEVTFYAYSAAAFSHDIAFVIPYRRVVNLGNDMIEKIELRDTKIVSQKTLYIKTKKPVIFSRHHFAVSVYKLVQEENKKSEND